MTIHRLFPRPLAPAYATEIERVRELDEMPEELRRRVAAAREWRPEDDPEIEGQPGVGGPG